MRVTWLHTNSYNYTVIYKILCQYRKANDNNVNNMHYALYTELISIVTTNHYMGDFHKPRKVFKHFLLQKTKSLCLSGYM